MKMDLLLIFLLLNTTIRHEGDGLRLSAEVRARNRKVMICFITDSQRYYAEAFSVFATGYLLYPFDVSELHNCITFFWQKPNMERRASLMLKETGGSYRRIYCRNILFIESSNRKVYLHLDNGEVMESYAKLDELEQQLPGKLFFLLPSELYYQSVFCGKNGCRKVRDTVTGGTDFQEISEGGAGDVL